MGYWSEMKVQDFVFDVSIDGVNMSRHIDTSDPRLGDAAITALKLYKAFYPIVEHLNTGLPIRDESEAVYFNRRLDDLSWVLHVFEMVRILRFEGWTIELPPEIDRVLATAYDLIYTDKYKPVPKSKTVSDRGST